MKIKRYDEVIREGKIGRCSNLQTSRTRNGNHINARAFLLRRSKTYSKDDPLLELRARKVERAQSELK